MKEKTHEVDFCVIGGGMAGLIAAVSAARKGIKTALIHDRPVLGGNASSEIRMWICGAHGKNNHETGILEEILLENSYRQTYPSYSVWDSILWEKAHFQENLLLLLNCSVNHVESADNRVKSVKGWQMTTETWHTITAAMFADCTGDGTIGAMAGAEYRIGREAGNEHGESIAPKRADKRTMGLSCLLQVRETDRKQEFIPPVWAYTYKSDDDLRGRDHTLTWHQNFWWLEVGGMEDSIHDTETIRDELLKIGFGIWDHIKNYGDHSADNWVLDWLGFLPGKRESRRFVGDHILTQNDIEAEGRHFNDIIAYGGWTMDDHFPEGFYREKAGTIFHPAPSPYGIPYRCLYSVNIENLFFAGRNISATHAAMSSTRVMATCSILGQAAGTAAAIAIRNETTPRRVYEKHLTELKNTLMEDDCYLPFTRRQANDLTTAAIISSSNNGKAEYIRNGFDRIIGENENAWTAKMGDSIEFIWDEPAMIEKIRIVFDSDLSRSTRNMVPNYKLDIEPFSVPEELVKHFRMQIRDNAGNWVDHVVKKNNYQRLVWVSMHIKTSGIKIIPVESWGNENVRIFAIDVY
ncbi:MAG: FAD-dependent oxidoreductase [Spirochaetales bacterium]|nr:FAD-dependent oxidoreductase [Spirochaetales bacterium]